ncbi:hypothetical protein [Micromonospora ureilytica]|uniref:Uncharacterized protein n=1 Tax=Micromonospora ureilytica TaxID=709868 RepID=A0ABS0JTA2_9ACTN|nr:hypothetical protein [Micromonospora ureilytica]MBG6070065.1 hypothetical protein [Micromonospora ureilytica]
MSTWRPLATPGPVSAEALHAARAAVLATLAARNSALGHQAAVGELAALPVDQLLDVAAVLASMVGRPQDTLITVDEWLSMVVEP